MSSGVSGLPLSHLGHLAPVFQIQSIQSLPRSHSGQISPRSPLSHFSHRNLHLVSSSISISISSFFFISSIIVERRLFVSEKSGVSGCGILVIDSFNHSSPLDSPVRSSLWFSSLCNIWSSKERSRSLLLESRAILCRSRLLSSRVLLISSF